VGQVSEQIEVQANAALVETRSNGAFGGTGQALAGGLVGEVVCMGRLDSVGVS